MLALEYGLMCSFTAFIAVDSLHRIDGEVESVQMPVNLPAGMRDGSGD